MSADPIGVIGSVVSEKYRIERFVAEGGFSVVYRAVHEIWNQPVAIKFFTALSVTSGVEREELEKAFIKEGALLAQLSIQTTAIVQARDTGPLTLPNGQWVPFLVLEWVEGETLDEILEREQAAVAPPWTLEQVKRLISQIATAMGVVHRHGVAHRDLKPGNILIVGGDPRTRDVRIKLLDFGVAKELMLDNAHLQAALTATGRTFSAFTPHYGAPEQFSRRFGATGPWTDVYALALIAVEMLIGRPALSGGDVAELSACSTDPARRPTPSRLGAVLPASAEAVFEKALALAPRDRYANADEFLAAFDAATAGAQASSVPPGPNVDEPDSERSSAPRGGAKRALLAGLVLAAGAAGGIVAWRTRAHGGAAPPRTASSSRSPARTLASAAPFEAQPVCDPGMSYVAPGLFFAGTDRASAPRNQRPAHQVRLSGYCFQRTEVTVADYKACIDGGHCREAPLDVEWPAIIGRDRLIFGALCNARYPDRGQHPLNCVDWQSAQTYCEAQGQRLPTEAEWEYVARGPSVERYPWGDRAPGPELLNGCGKECLKWSQRNDAGLKLLYYDGDGYPNTAPVARFPAGNSRFGPADIAGNVREWTSDFYGSYPSDPSSNPTGPASGEKRVVRGSSWATGDERELAHTYRSFEPPGARRHDLGFRCAGAPRR